jgi:hypothetical protein
MGYDHKKKQWFVRPWQSSVSKWGVYHKPGRAVWFNTAEDASEYLNMKTREQYAQNNNENEDLSQ